MFLSGGATHTSADPVGEAMDGIYRIRRRNLVLEGAISNYYTKEECHIKLCFSYLNDIGMENWDCDCPVKDSSDAHLMRHREKCSITPDFAAVCDQLGYTPLEVDTSIGFSMFTLVWKDWK